MFTGLAYFNIKFDQHYLIKFFWNDYKIVKYLFDDIITGASIYLTKQLFSPNLRNDFLRNRIFKTIINEKGIYISWTIQKYYRQILYPVLFSNRTKIP